VTAVSHGYEPLDLSILLGPDGVVWVSLVSRHGAVHGVPRSGGNLPSVAELQDATDDFEDAVAYARPHPGTDLGAALRDLIFGEPELLELFHRTRGAAADQGRQMLLRVLAAPSILGAVPWELLLDPSGGTHRYLTLAPDAHLVRAARSRTYPLRSEPLPPPLNLLLILSSPIGAHDDLTFDLFEEKRNLLGELKRLEERGLLEIDVEEHPTLERLRRRIGSKRDGYHVVHYLGHATPADFLLEDRYGRSQSVRAETFHELLRMCPQLRLTVFAGCDTARHPAPDRRMVVGEWRDGISSADRCVRESCPTVIGMRALLPFRTEALLTRFFYQGVTSGYSIAESMRLARAAIRGDEFVGAPLLDWAVASLVTGGDTPGALVDPTQSLTARRPRPRVELKFDMVEKEREFFSRLVPLRIAIDVLAAATTDRVLVVTGPAGVGKTHLADRALEDLGGSVDAVLYVRGRRLRDARDPLAELASWVAEILSRIDDGARQVGGGSGSDRWERLIGEFVSRSLVIVIDDIQDLVGPRPANRKKLLVIAKALARVANRRTRIRVALVGTEVPRELVSDLRAGAAFVNLLPYTWDEVWRWIRRNLPVLKQYKKLVLAEYYVRLGDRLELWQELANRVAARRGDADLKSLVEAIAPSRPVPAGTRSPLRQRIAPRSHRALRIAVAGPFLLGPDEFAASVTAYAAEHRVGGRIVPEGGDETSSLAILLPVESPFKKSDLPGGGVPESELLRWLDDIVALRADIVLMDYGAPIASTEHAQAVRRAARSGALLVAAAGNNREMPVVFPAAYESVLAVGALEGPQKPAAYTSLTKDSRKPEIFALDSVSDTPLVHATKEHTGTSTAALLVTAAAALVWAMNPGWDARRVRALLLESAQLLPEPFTWGRELSLDAALDAARASLVEEALASGPLTLAELLAGVGLPSSDTDRVLDLLVSRRRIRRTRERSTEAYQLT